MAIDAGDCWTCVMRGLQDPETASALDTLVSLGMAHALRARIMRDYDTRVARPAAAGICEALQNTAPSVSRGAALASACEAAFSLFKDSVVKTQWIEAVLAKSGSFVAAGSLSRRCVRRARALVTKLVPAGELTEALREVFQESFRDFGEDAMIDEESNSQTNFMALCSHLIALGFASVVHEAMGSVVFVEIDDKVRSAVSSRLRDEVLPGLRNWVDHAVLPWLDAILRVAPGDSDSVLLSNLGPFGREASPQLRGLEQSIIKENESVTIDQWRKRLAFHLHETVATVRIEQMLQLVAFYPRSLKALGDLKESLRCTDKKSHLVSSLREQFSIELLHAGTLTSDILQQYINMIKALRFLDPAGIILENVSEPVRNCLRKRPDTVRCIVSGMTGDGDLFEELERGRPKSSRSLCGESGDMLMSSSSLALPLGTDDDASDAGDWSDAESLDEEAFATWEPEPSDAPPRRGRWRPGGDAIATLVAIYGSSERIVSEYRTLLADKLVSNFEVDIDRESRILGLLQQRFGVEAMHDCVIMLKDMRDSRVSLATARAEAPAVARQLDSFEATVVSKEFWPKLAEEPAFKAPPDLAKLMHLFEASFERVKEPRKLRWMHGLGVAKLKIAFDDGRELTLNVTPFQAAIVLKFVAKPKWTVSELQKDLEVTDEAALRRRLVLLANQDIIRATDSSASSYEAIERAEDMDSSAGVADEDGMGDMGGGAGDEDEKDDEEAEMAVYETYILAMLRNLKKLPLDRIHSMLQMVCRTIGYDKTQTQLAAFLAQMVADEKIVFSGGMYKVS